MVELEYVKKRKRKKLAAIITAVSSAGVGVFVLVSFLGRFVGTFTVALNTGVVKLSLCDKSNFESATSYLKIDELPPFDLETYSNLPSAEEIDSEDTTYTYGTKTDASGDSVMYFFKSTFFIKNTGSVSAGYDLKVNITKNEPSADGRYLDTILRVMVYENRLGEDTHNYTVYARQSETPNPTGDENEPYSYKEYLSYQYNPRMGINEAIFAERFEDDNTIATISEPKFEANDVKRYTIVAWLEGEDQQAKGNPPEGGNLKLGVTINAYEKK